MFAYGGFDTLTYTKNAFCFLSCSEQNSFNRPYRRLMLGISRDRVYIGMVQSQAKLKNLAEPSMIMFDEAHHATCQNLDECDRYASCYDWRTIRCKSCPVIYQYSGVLYIHLTKRGKIT